MAVDLRRGSPHFAKWVARTLSGENGLAVWVPVGFAHGYMALDDNTYVWYKCTGPYVPDAERALNYKDPHVGIKWPMEPRIISQKDTVAPCLASAEFDFLYNARTSTDESDSGARGPLEGVAVRQWPQRAVDQ